VQVVVSCKVFAWIVIHWIASYAKLGIHINILIVDIAELWYSWHLTMKSHLFENNSRDIFTAGMHVITELEIIVVVIDIFCIKSKSCEVLLLVSFLQEEISIYSIHYIIISTFVKMELIVPFMHVSSGCNTNEIAGF
jgi:hypothetical protein